MEALKGLGMNIGDFAASLIEGGGVESEKPTSSPVKEAVEEGAPAEYVPDVSEVEVPASFVNELTSCGSIGVNMAGPQKDPMKDKKVKKKKKTVEGKKHASPNDLINHLRGYKYAQKPKGPHYEDNSTKYYEKAVKGADAKKPKMESVQDLVDSITSILEETFRPEEKPLETLKRKLSGRP